jgi:TrmH family RNA methyltransferase
MPAPLIITSPHNERVKLVRALQSQAKTRRNENKIVLEGVRLIEDALKGGTFPHFVLYASAALETGRTTATLIESLQSQKIDCLETDDALLLSISETQTPQGLIAVFPMPKLAVPATTNLVLILDGIADPGNLGTILRTAAAVPTDIVILGPGTVDAFNPKVLRGGMGAHFRLPIRKLDWKEIAELYGQLPIYLADAKATTVYTKVDWTHPCAVLIGGEAHGAQGMPHGLATQGIQIPMSAETESLNAAIAAAVILFEVRRVRAG